MVSSSDTTLVKALLCHTHCQDTMHSSHRGPRKYQKTTCISTRQRRVPGSDGPEGQPPEGSPLAGPSRSSLSSSVFLMIPRLHVLVGGDLVLLLLPLGLMICLTLLKNGPLVLDTKFHSKIHNYLVTHKQITLIKIIHDITSSPLLFP